LFFWIRCCLAKCWIIQLWFNLKSIFVHVLIENTFLLKKITINQKHLMASFGCKKKTFVGVTHNLQRDFHISKMNFTLFPDRFFVSWYHKIRFSVDHLPAWYKLCRTLEECVVYDAQNIFVRKQSLNLKKKSSNYSDSFSFLQLLMYV